LFSFAPLLLSIKLQKENTNQQDLFYDQILVVAKKLASIQVQIDIDLQQIK
jgi:hypothetical protein